MGTHLTIAFYYSEISQTSLCILAVLNQHFPSMIFETLFETQRAAQKRERNYNKNIIVQSTLEMLLIISLPEVSRTMLRSKKFFDEEQYLILLS